MGGHFLLQGIFLTQGSNPGLLHSCRAITAWVSLHSWWKVLFLVGVHAACLECVPLSLCPHASWHGCPTCMAATNAEGCWGPSHRHLHSLGHIHPRGASVPCASLSSDQLPLFPLPTVDQAALRMWTWQLSSTSFPACFPWVDVHFIREGATFANLPGPGRVRWARLGLSPQELGQAHSTSVPGTSFST